jgi:hypothetical protein
MLKLLRSSLSFVFGVQAIGLVPVLPMVLFQLIKHPKPDSNLQIPALLIACAGMTFLGVVFAAAWWGLKKDKAYARGWGIAASLINLALSIPLFRYGHLRSLGFLWLLPISGAVGVCVLWQRWSTGNEAAALAPVPGDGTGKVAGFLAWIVGSIGGAGGYFWWGNWAHVNGVPRSPGPAFWAQLFLILMVSIVLHEAGHLIVGWGLGMKIRGFAAGPFKWQIRDGKWEFQFNPKAIFSLGGSASMVPPDASEDRAREIGFIAAGPLANILTGMVAIGLALPAANERATFVQGLLMLFAVASIVGAIFNLIPFRAKQFYSDGARLYQILAGGPVADMHRVFSVIASSTVTPLRSREFDIESIHRVATGVAQGRQAMLLHLFAYQYYLDNGMMAEAADEMDRAEEIYAAAAAETPAELHTVFVFGNACVKQDALSARQWWDRMQAKKPKRFNADYWLSHSALHWIEGNRQVANESWQKGNDLAQKLPKAGAYEFDRHCFALLRQAMDEVPVAV